MLLTIDIGNTTTKFGVFDGENLVEKITKPTIRQQTAEEIKDVIETLLGFSIRNVIVSSVVPPLDEAYKKLSENYFHSTAIFVNSETDFGLEINYEQKENLGSDRLVTAFAASAKYSKPCIACNFGTATTIDGVNSNNEYLGGVIVPGMKTFADSLHLKAAKLPNVEIIKTTSIFGKTSAGSIQTGTFFGYIGLIEKIIGQMKKELGGNPKIIATGGFSGFIGENCDLIKIVDENLMLDGLRLIHESGEKKNFARE